MSAGIPEQRERTHQIISSYFIGPKAGNLQYFQENIETILEELKDARLAYFPNDKPFIPDDVKNKDLYKLIVKNFSEVVKKIAHLMGQQSIPFWSPRYEGHMCTDMTMPALLGYFMTMLYNPNNVTLEASPFTTYAEIKAGEQLCEMFGYDVDPNASPRGWGHITADGTIANLESIWVGKLQFLAGKFTIENCQGESKVFDEMTAWELLNLRPDTVLGIPQRLYNHHNISNDFLDKVMVDYNIQNISKSELEEEFLETDVINDVKFPFRYMVGKTRHYSWPKGAAIAGLGSDFIFKTCLDEKRPVYGVVAIMGSTEEGAVDNLKEIVKMRDDFKKMGMSFLLHADAAWGGYFATMLPRGKELEQQAENLKRQTTSKGFVPSLTLKQRTAEDLRALKYVDSITVGPHKAGYVPYPAGSLVYRDGRMRFLVTWTSPYLSQGNVDSSIGIFGVEGRWVNKPGAAAMSTWLSNKTIGLDQYGYGGSLLGEAAFTSARLSAYWAAIGDENDTPDRMFICVPLNRPPGENGNGYFSTEARKERDLIREKILRKSNDDIAAADEDGKLMELLRELGSDLNINAFALNWFDEHGRLNEDLEEANNLMKRHELYGECAQEFMHRLGVKKMPESLFVLRNVVMSPFPTDMKFIDELMREFKKVVMQEVIVSRERNKRGRQQASFLMQGTDEVEQVIVAADIWHKDDYVSLKRSGKYKQITLESHHNINLEKKIKMLAWKSSGSPTTEQDKKENKGEAEDHTLGEAEPEIPEEETLSHYPHFHDSSDRLDRRLFFLGHIYADGHRRLYTGVTLKRLVKSRPLNLQHRDHDYPQSFTPFYLYGTENQAHISHMMLRAPNASLTADNVHFDQATKDKIKDKLGQGLILGLTDYPEAAMQPIHEPLPEGFLFRKHSTDLRVKVWEDPNMAWAEGPGLLCNLGTAIAEGTMSLGSEVQVDAETVNYDPNGSVPPDPSGWQQEFDAIGSVLNTNWPVELTVREKGLPN
ncbi:pyridoxal phosphate-dependent transferase [Aspergillus welwitschiae]|uniref:Pyridoxal phosphate-dependent transferase n=1 Tax=Aspergillus welwitschiae TaxID=1341132 RepID=A0A3F3QB71_9EURO|nr:pyridoxal phosphate-dependent transferase [Aspergillus welwitschiae]RDH36369.1 pyridoxal phosphate-dependent transferase [Aspergillus welwitschiae]